MFMRDSCNRIHCDRQVDNVSQAFILQNVLHSRTKYGYLTPPCLMYVERSENILLKVMSTNQTLLSEP